MTHSSLMSTFRTFALLLASLAWLGCTPEGAKEGADGGDAPAGGEAGPVAKVAAPLGPGSSEIGAYLTIPNLEAALEGVAEIVKAVTPKSAEAFGKDQLKAQLGLMLGDPQLTNLDTSRPIVIALLGPASAEGSPLPLAVALVPAKQASPYDQALAAFGMQSRFANGLLEVALTPGSFEAAATARTLYDRIAGEKLETSARLHLNAKSLLKSFGPLLTQQMNQLPMLIGAAAGGDPVMGKILKAEMLGFMTVLEQCDALEFDIGVSGAGLQIDSRIAATPGSALAKLFSASRTIRPPTTIYVEGSSPLAVSYALDSASLASFTDTVLAKIAADPDCAILVTPDMRDVFKTLGDTWDGTAAMAMRPGKSLSIDYVIGIKDSEKFYGLLETSAKLMGPGSALGNMYKGMGIEMSVSFDRDTRTHSGVSIHRWKTSGKVTEAALGNPLGAGFVKSWLDQEMGIASVGQMGLVSSDASRLDRMIDAAKSGEKGTPLKLKAQEVFGDGRHGYWDYDIFAVMKTVFASFPDGQPGAAEMKQAVQLMPSTSSPIVMAITFGPARALVQIQTPISLFRTVAGMAQSMQPPQPQLQPPQPLEGAADGK